MEQEGEKTPKSTGNIRWHLGFSVFILLILSIPVLIEMVFTDRSIQEIITSTPYTITSPLIIAGGAFYIQKLQQKHNEKMQREQQSYNDKRQSELKKQNKEQLQIQLEHNEQMEQKKTEHIQRVKKYIEDKQTIIRLYIALVLSRKKKGKEEMEIGDLQHLFSIIFLQDTKDTKTRERMLNFFYEADIYDTQKIADIFSNIAYQRYAGEEKNILKEHEETIKRFGDENKEN